jgi:hypothetical protein
VTIIEERGIFWWHNDPIPENCIAPESSVPGVLRISKNGDVSLELDGHLPSDTGEWSILDDCSGKTISGLLRVTQRRVTLLNLISSGGKIRAPGLSSASYHAQYCIVSENALNEQIENFGFCELEIDLKGFEGWLNLPSNEVRNSHSAITVKHKKSAPIEFQAGEEKIVLRLISSGLGLVAGFRDHVELRDQALLSFYPSRPLNLRDMTTKFLWLNDLFMVLTDSSFDLCWPKLRESQNGAQYRLFFLRLARPNEDAPIHYEMPTKFPGVRDKLGAIIHAWLNKREEFGPGFYLYLGTRRGMQLYTEHRFASLVWGIEALHRKKIARIPNGMEIEARIERILKIVGNSLDRKDEKWLKSRLKHSHEPSLQDRIYEVLADLPIEGISQKNLRLFAKSCADLRNDISHFGSHRPGGSYDAFIQEITSHSEALSRLYHVLILHEVGISRETINQWLLRGFKSPQTRDCFLKVRLFAA